MITLSVLAVCGFAAFDHYKSYSANQQNSDLWSSPDDWPALGEIVYIHQDVPIYSNGEVIYKSHGRHFAQDGYYYGRKWQCVEFIKRFLYDKHSHQMPDPWGHAKQYFDHSISHANINPARNLIQYKNSSTTPPKADDLLVWDGKYGHVAIVTEVHEDHIIIAQQNIKNAPIARLPLIISNYTYTLGDGSKKPLGWLRIP